MAFELLYIAAALVSVINIVILTLRGNNISLVFAKKRRSFDYLILLITAGFGVFTFSEGLELLDSIAGIPMENMEYLNWINPAVIFILLSGQLIMLTILVRSK